MRAKSINFVASSIFIEYSSNSIAVTEVVTSQKTWIDLEVCWRVLIDPGWKTWLTSRLVNESFFFLFTLMRAHRSVGKLDWPRGLLARPCPIWSHFTGQKTWLPRRVRTICPILGFILENLKRIHMWLHSPIQTR